MTVVQLGPIPTAAAAGDGSTKRSTRPPSSDDVAEPAHENKVRARPLTPAAISKTQERTPPMTNPETDIGVPDFAALYEPHLAEGTAMTPRMACWLWQAALVAAESWRIIADRAWIENALPPIAWRYAEGRWLNDYVLGFDRIADRIAGGGGDTALLARCTAEELALHEIIATAETYLDEGVLDVALADALPDHDQLDRDFDLMRDVLFEDHDVLMLFNPALDGIEDPSIGGSANLHPRDWFNPFR